MPDTGMNLKGMTIAASTRFLNQKVKTDQAGDLSCATQSGGKNGELTVCVPCRSSSPNAWEKGFSDLLNVTCCKQTWGRWRWGSGNRTKPQSPLASADQTRSYHRKRAGGRSMFCVLFDVLGADSRGCLRDTDPWTYFPSSLPHTV